MLEQSMKKKSKLPSLFILAPLNNSVEIFKRHLGCKIIFTRVTIYQIRLKFLSCFNLFLEDLGFKKNSDTYTNMIDNYFILLDRALE